MTQQQIDYWKLKEAERANQAAEIENRRFHTANEALTGQANQETQRHNRAMEYINRMNLDIAARNAAVNELNARTNAVLAQLTAARDRETARHNSQLEIIQAEYNKNILEYDKHKLEVQDENADADRSSRETVAEHNILSSETINAMNRRFGLYSTAGNVVGGIIGSAIRNWGHSSGLTTSSTIGTTASSSYDIIDAMKAEAARLNAAEAASSGITTAGGAMAAGALGSVLGAGLIGAAVGGVAAYAASRIWPNGPYVGDRTDYNSYLKKGARWYGAE